MMRRLLPVLLYLCSISAFGQTFSFEYWHNGTVILEGNDTLRGSVRYDMRTDIVEFQKGGRVEPLTARKVVYFEIFDALTHEYRRFFSLPYSNNGSYKAPMFFELLSEGKMTLLSRETLEYRTYSSFSYYGNYTRLELVYRYYLLHDSGDIREFQGKKNDWIYEMGNQGTVVQKYVKANKLNFDKRKDLVKIVEYYNSLFKN